ncbi:MAG TPA: macro domain-containing protein [Oscillospiraceae bacterium]|nr:macro domain-containing protein [Oscillospiraceae bacterium]
MENLTFPLYRPSFLFYLVCTPCTPMFAKEHDVHSIAFPAISTGVYGYPLEDATEIAVKTVAQWLEAHADYAMQVIFCCFDARTERVYQARL